MKSLLGIGIVALVLLVIAGAALGGLYYYLNFVQKPSSGIATLYKESGEVFYKPPTDSDYVALTSDKIEITNETKVKTSKGFAHIIFPDNSMTSLDENTEIIIEVKDSETTIFQIIGNTYNRVNKIGDNSQFNVESDNTLAAVRGTKFAFRVDQSKKETVLVTESNVDISYIGYVNGTKAQINTNTLSEGNYLENKYPEDYVDWQIIWNINKTTDQILSDKWLQKNGKIDYYYEYDLLVEDRVLDLEFIEEFKKDPTIMELNNDLLEKSGDSFVIDELINTSPQNVDQKVNFGLSTGNLNTTSLTVEQSKEICKYVNSQQFEQDLRDFQQYSAVISLL